MSISDPQEKRPKINMASLTQCSEWKALSEHHKSIAAQIHIRKLFEDDPARFEKFR